MKRYFVKAPVSGWHEVCIEQYERFVDIIRNSATPTIPMDELIKKLTKVIDE